MIGGSIALAAAIAVRNPFWPIDYEGELESISADPKVEVNVSSGTESEETTTAATAAATAAVAAAVEQNARNLSSRAWSDAKKTLRISGASTGVGADGSKHHAVTINGFTYGDGDLVSTNHNGHRFTWRVIGLTDSGALRLRQVRVRDLTEEEMQTEGTKK